MMLIRERRTERKVPSPPEAGLPGTKARAFAVYAAIMAALVVCGLTAKAQSVYGVRTSSRTVVATQSRTTVVRTGGGVVAVGGTINTLPGGYTMVTVRGARYYTVGDIYYRPQIQYGRTVYVRVQM